MTEYQPFEFSHWHGVSRAFFAVPGGDLDAWLGALEAQAGRKCKSRWIAPPGEGCPWFVKVLTAASEHDSLWNRLKWRMRPSRMLHTWQISQDLQASGFVCPDSQLAARKRTWRPFGWPTDVLVMSPIGGQPVSELLHRKPPQEILSAIANELARFHAAGFVHGDCIAGNLFLQTDGRLAFIDNDRTMRTSFWDCTARIRRNLVQFGFHLLLDNLASRTQLEDFFLEYIQVAQWPPRKRVHELSRIWHWIERRLATESP